MDNSLKDHPYVKELYVLRKVYHAALFNEWAMQGLYEVHKSKRHSDNRICFGGDLFIVAAILPTGLISNHYYIEDWELFRVPETDKAVFPYDGHLPQDVINRMIALLRQ